MNIQIQYNKNDFDEVHPTSNKSIPLVEEIPCKLQSGSDGATFTFRWKEKESVDVHGAPQPLIDRIKRYLCGEDETGTFTGQWRVAEAGRDPMTDAVKYSQESFDFTTDKARLMLRMQDQSDRLKVQFCPEDQVRTFTGEWTDPTTFKISVSKASAPETGSPLDQEIAKMNALDDADLETLFPQYGLTWDNRNSRNTRVTKLAEARIAKRNGDVDAPENDKE